jgi:putative tryptophan/tyrosine transport system substrate-binding protein
MTQSDMRGQFSCDAQHGNNAEIRYTELSILAPGRQHIKRREFITLLCGMAAVWPLTRRAQSLGKMPRIGMLWHAGSADEEWIYLAAFRQGLADAGYVEGRNIVVEHRFPAEKAKRSQSMAAELVELKMDVLVAAGQPPALALQRATATIPIVFVGAYDPIGVGLVNSIARPSGNITGLSLPDLIGKRLEIFREALPNLSRVVVLINATNPSYAQRYSQSVQNDARKLQLACQPVEVDGPTDLERAFSSITQEMGTGIAAAADGMFYNERKRMSELALAHRLPSMFHNEELVRSGGLMSYGANVPAIFRHSALYVDKILKGEKPSELPVEQPSLFRLFVNLKTAENLGLTIPPTLLIRADEVIE